MSLPEPTSVPQSQDDSVAERHPCARGWCVSCHLVSDFERVCELVLCDGVLHRETVSLQTNCDSRVQWHVGILTKCADSYASNYHEKRGGNCTSFNMLKHV